MWSDCATANMRKDGCATLVTIDCDLYERAAPVFSFVRLIDQRSVIYIDDYADSPRNGVARSFHEFRERSHFDFVDWGRIGGCRHSFVPQRR